VNFYDFSHKHVTYVLSACLTVFVPR
jgi:hypothetical protein